MLDKDQLHKLYKEGLTQKEIAKEVGASRELVRYWLHQHNIHFVPSIEKAKDKKYLLRSIRRDNKITLLDSAGTNKCARCSYDKELVALDFHHLDKDTKSYTVSSKLQHLDSALKESQKCEILCANCHREEHETPPPLACSIHPKHSSDCSDCMNFYMFNKRRSLKTLLVNKIFENKCFLCSYSYSPRVYDFHHINKNNKNKNVSYYIANWSIKNIIEEIVKCCMLCANCHRGVENNIDLQNQIKSNFSPKTTDEVSFTIYSEFASKGYIYDNTQRALIRDPRFIKTCQDCNKEIDSKAKRCSACYRKTTEKIEWPSLEALHEELKLKSYSQLGRELGVSDNAIRKHLKKQTA